MQDSTLEGLEREPAARLRTWASRVTLALLLVVVLTGLSGRLGVHTETVSASGNGYTLKLEYPRIARAGLDVTWRVTIHRDGGFGKTIDLAVSADQFDIYETQGFFPEPDSSTRDADTLTMTFVPPNGETFVVTFDAYIQPSSQVGRDATMSVMDSGEAAATVSFSTLLAP